MGTKDRREREKQELRTSILGAARELFVERGYEAVTMREIARKIEYSPTAIYLHFQDKLDVMRACCQEDFLALARQFQRIAKISDPIERLTSVGRAYAGFAARYPNHYRLMFMTPHPPVEKEGAIEKDNPEQDAYGFLKWTVGQAIAAGRLRPDLADVELVSQLVWSGIHGLVSLRIAKGDDPWVAWRPRNRMVEAMLDLQLRGILRDGDPGRE